MPALTTLGLWGDGEEIYAIEDAFKALAIRPPVEDAPNWLTVGDLWKSAQRVSPEATSASEAWDIFRRAISEETCVDWREIELETTLIDGRGHNIISRILTSLRERFRHA